MAFSLSTSLKSLVPASVRELGSLSALSALATSKPQIDPTKAVLSPVAVDFGASALKVLQVQTGGGEASKVTAAACIPTPPELLTKDTERLAFQFDALRGVIKSAPFKGKRAVCSVSARRSLVQHLQIKNDGTGMIAEKVRAQIAASSGCDPSMLILRHYEAGEVTRSGAKCIEVIAFVMPRDGVLAHVKALKDAKLEVVGVHGEHLALVHMFDPITKRAEDDQLTSLYIDLGATTAKLAVAHGRKLALAKTLSCGVALSKSRQQNTTNPDGSPAPTAAEADLPSDIDTSVPVDRRAGATPPGMVELPESEPNAPAIKLTPSVEQLTDEIAMSIRYHQALFPGRAINRTVFVGGGSNDTELCRHVAKKLRVAAQVADPLSTFETPAYETPGVDLLTPQPGWALPLGLCLSPTDL